MSTLPTTHLAAGAPAAARDQHVVVIGGGQSARWLLYLFAEQLARDPGPMTGVRITVVESGPEFGTGLAWNRDNVLEEHLASRADLVTRWQYGDQQKRQFAGTSELLREMGAQVTTMVNQEVVDLAATEHGFDLALDSGATLAANFVVLATGYGTRPWRGKAAQLDHPAFAGMQGIHRSPWPARALQQAVFGGGQAQARQVLLLGSYLTAVDTAVTLALQAGKFSKDQNGRLAYEGPADFHVRMASRTGLLPTVWGRESARPWMLRHFTESAVRQLREPTPQGQFVSLNAALRLLGEELAAAAREIDGHVPSVLARLHNPARRLRAFRKLMSRRDAAATLDGTIAELVSGEGATGTYTSLRHCGWQAPIDKAIALWNECSPWFPAEDVARFDAELRSTFFNYMLPMTLNSALELGAMMRSGHLSCLALGPGYALRPAPDGGRGVALHRAGPDGATEVSLFTDVIDATGHEWDIEQNTSPLFRSLLARKLIQPALRPFRDGALHARPAPKGSIVERGGRHFLRSDGVHANPRTCESIPATHVEQDYSRGARMGLYAMGPNLAGQFADAQSIGHARRDATRIVQDLRRKSELAS
jgi:uncharacterized NAD(P)/FAD-binding protein YdhS